LRCDCGYGFPAESASQERLEEGSVDAGVLAPSYILFDHWGVWVATFFGQPLGGSIPIAVNYLRLGAGATVAALTILVGLVATGLVMLFVAIFPWGQGTMILDGLVLLLTMKYAKAIQGSAVEEHKRRGGRLASRWTAFGIGVAALAFNGLMIWVVSTRDWTWLDQLIFKWASHNP
jgi:hypothetical protein